MKKLVFSGCSFTAGFGWDQSDPTRNKPDAAQLWTNICQKNIPHLSELDQINIGESGSSNTEIFENTVNCMSTTGNIDTIICQWTAMPRYTLNVGFELWETSKSLYSRSSNYHVELNNGIVYSQKYINDLADKLRVLQHIHWEIVKVVKYTNIISNLAKLLGIKNVFFVNGLCPWDANYFTELHNVNPQDYTNFTKTEILDIKNRNDADIFKLYKKAHQHYAEAGGINESEWINLYNSFNDQIIDFNFDGHHPGVKSNEIYAQLVVNKFNNLNI